MHCRKNIAALTATEKATLVNAILALKAGAVPAAQSRIPAAQAAVSAAGGTPNRYDDYVWLHNQIGFGSHRRPAFGPWHREFLRQFEFDLRAVSGDATLTLPYWDFAAAQTSASAGWPFKDDLLGGLGSAASFTVASGPFANPATWRVNFTDSVRCPGTTLRRRRSQAPMSLPSRAAVRGAVRPAVAVPYDVAPFDSNPGSLTNAQFAAQTAAAFRKNLEWLLHDGVHVAVGGAELVGPDTVGGHMSFPPIAVSDPVFWLLHCNVDRLWWIWEQLHHTAPYTAAFDPATGGPAGHNLNDTMALLATASWFNTPVLGRPVDVVDNHSLGTWYQSDRPEVTLAVGSVSFGDVPAGLTTYAPISFDVRTCQDVKFRISAISAGNFSEPAGQGIVTVGHSELHDPVRAHVYVQFHSTGTPSSTQVGTVTVEAFFVDPEGLFAATEGGEVSLGTFTVNLSARPVPKPRAAVSLVLDRSGSMSDPAGPAGSKVDLLRSSLQVISDILLADDAVGLTSFDDVTTVISPIQQMGTNPATPGTGRNSIAAAISGSALNPRNTTGIGNGMIAGAGVLEAERSNPATPYTRFGMVVMTDGNENEVPYTTAPSVSAAIAGFANNVYAIGLGDETNVSATTLGTIARYMLITGEMNSAARRFALTKYFVQALVGVSGSAIVTDPTGVLLPGAPFEIPFDISDADVSFDAISLSPLAPLLSVTLRAPDGTVIDPSNLPANASLGVNLDDQFYRVMLPADPANPSGTHAGRWTAVLEINPKGLPRATSLSRLDRSYERQVAEIRQAGGLPYSVLVTAYSGLTMDAELVQTDFTPGTSLRLIARLAEGGVPIDGTAARVWVEVSDPVGQVITVPLVEVDGAFVGAFTTSSSGLYTCRFRAAGVTRQRQRFEREQTRSAVVGRLSVPVDGGTGGAVGGLDVCELVECLADQHGVRQLLERHDIDAKRLVECVHGSCRHDHHRHADDGGTASDRSSDRVATVTAKVGRDRLGAALDQARRALKQAPRARTIRRPVGPPVAPHDHTMHTFLPVTFDAKGDPSIADLEVDPGVVPEPSSDAHEHAHHDDAGHRHD